MVEILNETSKDAQSKNDLQDKLETAKTDLHDKYESVKTGLHTTIKYVKESTEPELKTLVWNKVKNK